MKSGWLCLLTILALVVGAITAAAESTPAEIGQAIRQLGDAKQTIREAATQQLLELGEPARQQLQRAREASQDQEVNRRIDLVLKKLDEALLAKSELHVVGLHQPQRGPFESVLPREINYRTFCAAVTAAGAKEEASPGKRVWDLLPPNVQALAKDEKLLAKSNDFPDPQSHQTLDAIRGALNKMIAMPSFYDPWSFASVPRSDRLKDLIQRRAGLTSIETRWLNRALFAAAFPKDVLFDPEKAEGELVTVEVKAKQKPIVLALCAHHAVRWDIKIAPGAHVVRVIVSGYEPQEVAPVEAKVDNYSRGQQRGRGDDVYFYAFWKGNPNDREGADGDRSYNDMAAKLKQLTGKDIDSFQGQTRYDGRPFVIADPVKSAPIPKDAELHVVAVQEAGYITIPNPRNWANVCRAIREASQRPDQTPARRLWDRLPEYARVLVHDEEGIKKSSTSQRFEDQQPLITLRAGLCAAVRHPGFFDKSYFPTAENSAELRPYLEKFPKLTPLEHETFCALLLAHAFPDEFEWKNPEGYEHGTVKVRVPVTEKPVILVLSAVSSIRWFVEVDQRARLHAVIVVGSQRQEVSGANALITYRTVEHADRVDGAGSSFYFPISREAVGERSFDNAATRLQALTGIKDIASFQSQSRYDGQPFVIGPQPKLEPVPGDAEVHVVALDHAGDSRLKQPRDWVGFCRQLAEQGPRPEPTPARRLWEFLPERIQTLMADEALVKQSVSHRLPEDHQRMHSLRDALFAAVRQPDFYQADQFARAPQNEELRGFIKRGADLTFLERERFGNLLLQAAFPELFPTTGPGGYVPGTVQVRVPAMDKPVVLVLSGNQSLRWFVEADPKTRLARVIVCGYFAQEVSGVAAPIIYRTHEKPSRTNAGPYFYFPYDRKEDREGKYDQALEAIRKLTGIKEIKSIQSQYNWDGRPFVIGAPPRYPAFPKDAELHVIGVREAYSSGFTDPANDADWLALITAIEQQADAPNASPGKRVWNQLSPQARQLFRDKVRLADYLKMPPNARNHPVAIYLGSLLNQRDLYEAESFGKVKLSPEAAQLLPRLQEADPFAVRRFNRLLLGGSFPGLITPAATPEGDSRRVVVKVKAAAKPIVLVLTAHETVHWVVEAEPGANINQVILSGYLEQKLAGLDVPTRHRSSAGGDRYDRASGFFLAIQKDTREYTDLEEKLRQLTGLAITSFQGRAAGDGKPFVIGVK